MRSVIPLLIISLELMDTRYVLLCYIHAVRFAFSISHLSVIIRARTITSVHGMGPEIELLWYAAD